LENSPNNRSSTAVRSGGFGLGPEDLFLYFEFSTFFTCSRVPFSAQLHCHLTLSFQGMILLFTLTSGHRL